MIDWLRWLVPKFQVPTWEDGLLVITVIFIGFIIQKYLIAKITQKFANILKKANKPFISRIIREFETSIRYAFFTAMIFLGLSLLLEVSLFENKRTSDIFMTLFLLFIFKGIYDVLEYFGKHPQAFQLFNKNDDVLKPYIIRLLKVITIIITIFIIASFWKFNVNGFLTGIGLTGVAVAFSVRETLTHIVSGMSIVLDRPFQIGDWITTEDKKIDGIVEDVNLRSTLIHTLDKGLVYVPNSYLVNRPIFNLANRPKRKCDFYTYVASSNTEQQLRTLCEELQEQIALHPKSEKELISVSIDEIYASSFRIYVRFYVMTNDQSELLQVRQDILFAMHELIHSNDIAMANVQEEMNIKN